MELLVVNITNNDGGANNHNKQALRINLETKSAVVECQIMNVDVPLGLFAAKDRALIVNGQISFGKMCFPIHTFYSAFAGFPLRNNIEAHLVYLSDDTPIIFHYKMLNETETAVVDDIAAQEPQGNDGDSLALTRPWEFYYAIAPMEMDVVREDLSTMQPRVISAQALHDEGIWNMSHLVTVDMNGDLTVNNSSQPTINEMLANNNDRPILPPRL